MPKSSELDKLNKQLLSIFTVQSHNEKAKQAEQRKLDHENVYDKVNLSDNATFVTI